MQQHPHSMIVQRGANFAAIYSAISEYLSKGCAIMYSAEKGSSAQVLSRMVQSGILPDAEDHVQSKMLTIVDEKTVAANKTGLDAAHLTELLFSSALGTRRKSGAKKVIVICDARVLLEKGDYAKQVEFEQAITRKFEENESIREQVEVVCCYNPAMMRKLSLKHLVPMVNSHDGIRGRDWKYNAWYPAAVIEIIAAGIEKSLDPLTAGLILKTFKLVYKMDKDAIISNPALFEETLRKMLGSNAADVVLASIMDEAKRRITLPQQA